jgi:hypothetical protein
MLGGEKGQSVVGKDEFCHHGCGIVPYAKTTSDPDDVDGSRTLIIYELALVIGSDWESSN